MSSAVIGPHGGEAYPFNFAGKKNLGGHVRCLARIIDVSRVSESLSVQELLLRYILWCDAGDGASEYPIAVFTRMYGASGGETPVLQGKLRLVPYSSLTETMPESARVRV